MLCKMENDASDCSNVLNYDISKTVGSSGGFISSLGHEKEPIEINIPNLWEKADLHSWRILKPNFWKEIIALQSWGILKITT